MITASLRGRAKRAVALGIAAVIGLPAVAISGVAHAAIIIGEGEELTRFEIDGDPIKDVHSAITPQNDFVSGDWGVGVSAAYGPIAGTGTIAPQEYTTGGVQPLLWGEMAADDYPTVPAEGCPAGQDDNWNGGTKVADIVNIDDVSALTGCGSVTPKADLIRAYTAYEIVTVAGVDHTVIYGAWERGEDPGELYFYVPISDGVAGNTANDRLIAFDYKSSDGSVSYRILSWNGSAWVTVANPPMGAFQGAVGFADGDPFSSGNPSFGEFALDLTAAGILLPPQPGQCTNYTTAGYVFTETGNSAQEIGEAGNAQLKDYISATPLDLSNCGDVTVTKTVAGTATDWAFDFTISPVPAGETATKTATSASPTVAWDGLVPGTEYTITEAAEPGFVNGDVSCGEGGATFTPDPGESVTCAVTNTELADVSVTKTVKGTATDWAFDFTISPVPAGETATKTATSASPTVSWANLLPRTAYTITEAPEPGFVNGTVACGEDGATFTPTAGESVTCAVTNTELADVAVTKTVAGTATDWAFDFTISPVPAGETATKTANAGAPTVAWDGLVPGVEYTITESTESGFANGAISCGEGGATFTPDPGESVTCAVTNTELADVAVTKTVVPAGETGWSYDFTISPVPTGETATKSATSAAPTVGWSGLVPGTAYTITEASDTDLVVGTMTCTGGTNGVGTSTFTPTPGQDVTCAITNTRIADIAIVKSASPTTVLAGGNVTWTIQVTNEGPSTALDVTLVDELPAALTLLSIDPPAVWNCSASVIGNPGKVSCSKPNMLPGETWTFTLTTSVAASAGGQSITNTAVVSTTTDETSVSNNQDSADINVQVLEQEVPLPATGGDVQNWLMIAGLMVLAGLALVAVDRRRRLTS